jgi:hypothetical protein
MGGWRRLSVHLVMQEWVPGAHSSWAFGRLLARDSLQNSERQAPKLRPDNSGPPDSRGGCPHIRVLRLMHSCYPPCKQRKGGAPSIAVISANRRAGSCPFPFFGSESRDNFYVAGWHCILLDRTDRDLPQRGRIAGDTSRIIGGPARSIPWRPKTLLTQIKKTNRPRVGKLSREVGLGESNSSRCTKRSRLP